MNVKQALNLDPLQLKSLSTEELASVVNVLVSASNKRLKRIEQANLTHTATYENMRERYRTDKPRFSTKDLLKLSKQQRRRFLQSTYVEAKQFLENKTSSVTGIKNVEKDLESRLRGKVNETSPFKLTDKQLQQFANLSERTKKKFWKAYRKVGEAYASDVSNFGSDVIQQMVAQIQLDGDKRRSADAIFDDFVQQFQENYELLKESEETDDLSSMFNELDEY